jgi:16S rRNA (cytosine1402-N4)-methyltransferase
MADEYHAPVLLNEVLKFWFTRTDGVYVDATIGGGGHSEALLQNLDSNGILIGIDADESAIEYSRKRLSQFVQQVQLKQGNYSNIANMLREKNLSAIDGILFDLGVSSHQLDDPSKGFSFRFDTKLDMRMDRRQPLTAYNVLNEYSEVELADIFIKYGEERFSRRIAAAIVKERTKQPINTTSTLRQIIEKVVGQRFIVKSLARIFQALRIEVNKELESLRAGLTSAIANLNIGGRIVVISYHSLEDKIVKDIFRQYSGITSSKRDIYGNKMVKVILKILTKKVVLPQPSKIMLNPRARSAKLRAAEKIG